MTSEFDSRAFMRSVLREVVLHRVADRHRRTRIRRLRHIVWWLR